jgi:peptidoglycan-associated lipoprotein
MRRAQTILILATLAAMAACGNKTKKQETLPTDTSSGTETADAKPVEATTETPADPHASLQDVIYFEFDKSDLDDSARSKLAENAAWLKEDPKRTLTIEGHTDEVGTPEYNLGLGERRARAAREYLTSMGVDATRVSIITFGEEKPASDQDSLNRRSVFIATRK